MAQNSLVLIHFVEQMSDEESESLRRALHRLTDPEPAQ